MTDTAIGTGYQQLGLRPVINAAATLTKLGGSLMPAPVLDAMRDAAGQFVDMAELQSSVGRRLADLTGNEAGYVTSGAAAGITLTVTACIAGTDPDQVASFPHRPSGEPPEVVVFHSQRNGYDYAARQTGALLVEVDGTVESFTAALTGRTACVLWFAGANFAAGALPIEQVVEIAHARGVTVLVDAAAQIPPISTLWHFTREAGADAVIVSGGKGLRGPQASGLVLGRQDIIDGCRANGGANHAIGRPMKAGKEEILGLLAAVEWSLAQDEPATIAAYEESVRRWVDGLAGFPGVTVERGYPSEAGQPHGRAILRFAPSSPWTRDQVVAALWDGEPRIAVSALDAEPDVLAINPQTLQPGEDVVVLDALRRILSTAQSST